MPPRTALLVTALAAGATGFDGLVNPCLNATFAKYKFCDVSASIDDRVADLVSRLTLKEKIGALGTKTPDLPSVGLPTYNWWSEATHGISHVGNDDTTPGETNFALPITTACSFNRSLWRSTGSQIGTEARAFMNAGNAYSTYWAPVINLVRDPRWGRNIETPGEDPYLSGQYAIEFVQGMQKGTVDAGEHVQASACCKHYVANSMDHSIVDGQDFNRMDFDASVNAQDLVDSYMAPFQDCVEQGEVTGLMCSYNAINGVPACANPWLLDTVARGQWGFDGYVTSDCDADANIFTTHKYTKTPEEAVALALEAGTDVDCGGFVQQYAQSALDKKLITEDLIDTRLSYLFRIRMRLAHFDPPGPLQKIPPSAVCTEKSKQLAREGSVQGTVLLKNKDKFLPWSEDKSQTTALIGPLTDSSLTQAISNYYASSKTCDGVMYNLTDAIAQYGTVAGQALGVQNVTTDDRTQIDAAVELAKSVDRIVMGVGQDLSIEREGHDRVDISFSAAQTELIEKVAAAAKNPILVVVLTAGAVDVSGLMSNDKIGAVLQAGQPSVQVLGVGDLIYGKRVPAGRMVQMIYPSSYTNEISIFDMNMRPGPSEWPAPGCSKPIDQCPKGKNPGRTYRFYTGTPVVPFGFGLSYSSFEYKVISAPTEASVEPIKRMLAKENRFPSLVEARAPLAQYAVNVTNTGDVDAADVILGFITPPDAGKNGVPLQSLFGFDRVFLKAGETKTVYLAAGLRDFTTVVANGTRVPAPGQHRVRFGLAETRDLGMGFAETTVLLQ